MAIIMKKKVTPAKTSGGMSVTSTTKKTVTPIVHETGDKSYGKVGKPDSTSPERKAMNLAIVKARSEGRNTGTAESGKYKGKAYAVQGATYSTDKKVTSDVKVTPPKATFTVTKKTPPHKTPGKVKGKEHGARGYGLKFKDDGGAGKPEGKYYKTSKRLKMMGATKRYH
jgi:hypothetical protein